jgi:hypothetical protein
VRAAQLVPQGAANLFRRSEEVFAEGQVFAARGMEVTCLDVRDGVPRRAIVRFTEPGALDRMLVVTDTQGAFSVIKLPEEGFGMPLDP